MGRPNDNSSTLGRAGVKITALCLGTMNFGGRSDEAASRAMLDAYVAGGGNFVDNAHVGNDARADKY